jgi:hypothetical protein
VSKNLAAALACMALIILITFASASGLGFSKHAETIPSLPAAQMVVVLDEGQPYPTPAWLPVQKLTYTNTFLPRQVLLPRATGCLLNSTSKYAAYATLRWNTGQAALDQNPGDVLRLGLETRTVTLEIQPSVTYRSTVGVPPRPVDGTGPVKFAGEPAGFDVLYLFIFEQTRGFKDVGYIPCDNLQDADLAKAVKIPLI